MRRLRTTSNDARSLRADRNCGFTLLELLTAIILLGVAGLMFSRLFAATFRVIRDAPVAHNQIAADEAMLRQLRADIWSARAVRVESDGSSLKLDLGDNATISWTIDRDQARRKSGDERSSWPRESPGLGFESVKAGVIVRTRRAPGAMRAADDSILMASEVLQLREIGVVR